MMEKTKIALICYQKNEEYTEECIRYLEHLWIPEWIEADFLLVDSEESVYHAYEEGMQSTDAQIKIYFANDTFLTNQNILLRICDAFANNKNITAIGIDGWKENCLDIVCNERPNAISAYLNSVNQNNSHDKEKIKPKEGNIQSVEAINNVILATKEDVSWTAEAIVDYPYPLVFHSVCMKKAGYSLGVLLSEKRRVISASYSMDIYDISDACFQSVKEFCLKDIKLPDKRFYMPSSKLVAVDDVKWALILDGHDYVFSPKEVDFMEYSEVEKDEIVEELKRNHCNCAITRDYSRTLARACYEMNIPYLAWSFDTPLQSLYKEEAKLPTNHIFSFDKKMIEQIHEIYESAQLYPIPLAVNMERNAGLVVSNEDEEKYSCEVSMVGNLYEKNFYKGACEKLCSQEVLQEIEHDWFERVYGNWNLPNAIHGYLSDDCVTKLVEQTSVNAKESLNIENRFYEEVQISKEITHRERVGALNRIAEKYPVTLYTGSNTEALKNVKCFGEIDYYYVAPKVFHLSKINLNITLRSIESGVIQRIYDIMAVGGFVLTNAQPEIEDYFEIGKDLAVFHDFDEMMELIDYYLSHEEERVKIAMNGYQKVRDLYNYQKVINDMIQTVFHESKG